MLIQCQSCNSKYRLNLERIPSRRSFIKCKKCSGPIYIDPREVAAQEDGAGPDLRRSAESMSGGASEAGADGLAPVTCTNCGARYRVPPAQLAKQGLKLKCTNCDNLFPVPEGLAGGDDAQTPPAPVPEEMGGGVPSPDFYPSVEDSGEQVAAAGEQQMPLPDDARVSTMFDDLKVNLGTGQSIAEGDPASMDDPPGSSPDDGTNDPERAYLDAVSFTDDGSPPKMPSKGSLSDDKKYHFFMKPGVEGEKDMADGNGPEDNDLPPLDDADQALAGEVETDVQGEPPFVPPLDSGGAQPAADEGGTDELAGLPAIREEPKPEHPNPPVPGQELSEEKENRRYRMLWVAVATVLLVAVAWGWWLWNLPGDAASYALRDGSPAEFSITNTRKGYFITNKPSGERLYVLTGEVVNGFDGEDQVGWIRLKGTTIGSRNTNRESFSYIGNLLNDNQLATWALPAIKAYYGYLNGRDDGNFQIPKGKGVPFQIVLAGVRQPISQITTELVSYQRRGLPVYVGRYQ